MFLHPETQPFCRLALAQLRLGLLDPPDRNPYASIPLSAANSLAHRTLALQTAREGIVLLSNPRSELPLDPSSLEFPRSLAVVGPNAQMVAYGNCKPLCFDFGMFCCIYWIDWMSQPQTLGITTTTPRRCKVLSATYQN